MSGAPFLIIFGGLPGVGKTTIAEELARQIGAVHVRIDSIEQALRDSGTITGPMDDRGYRVAYGGFMQRRRRSRRDSSRARPSTASNLTAQLGRRCTRGSVAACFEVSKVSEFQLEPSAETLKPQS